MRTLCLLIFLFCYDMASHAQVGGVVIIANGKRYTASSTSIITDTAGRVYAYAEWTKLFATGDYAIEATDSTGFTDRFYIIRMTPEQRREYFSDGPKPRQTSYLTLGVSFPGSEPRTWQAYTLTQESWLTKYLSSISGSSHVNHASLKYRL